MFSLTERYHVGWTCAGCSGSLSSYVAHPAFAAIVVTFIIILLSGFQLLRHAPGLR
jgi:hypothetical protein